MRSLVLIITLFLFLLVVIGCEEQELIFINNMDINYSNFSGIINNTDADLDDLISIDNISINNYGRIYLAGDENTYLESHMSGGSAYVDWWINGAHLVNMYGSLLQTGITFNPEGLGINTIIESDLDRQIMYVSGVNNFVGFSTTASYCNYEMEIMSPTSNKCLLALDQNDPQEEFLRIEGVEDSTISVNTNVCDGAAGDCAGKIVGSFRIDPGPHWSEETVWIAVYSGTPTPPQDG